MSSRALLLTHLRAQSELKNSTADWIVVVGNDPIWSVGANGPAPGLAARLLPMLNAAVRRIALMLRVDAALSDALRRAWRCTSAGVTLSLSTSLLSLQRRWWTSSA